MADTEEKRIHGLQHIERLPANAGMLFIFPKTDVLHFWMKNTPVALSIAFLDHDGTIMQINSMEPYSLDSVRSKKPCRYALEVNKGWFANKGIGVGQRVKIPRSVAIPLN